MKKISFAFFEGISTISEIIKRVTGSRFSHVAYYNEESNMLIECWAADTFKITDLISFSPISNLNRKFCWKFSKFENHEKGTPYTILSLEVSEEVFTLVDSHFRFMARYSIPYDILGLFGRLNRRLENKYGMYCSEGVQNILIHVDRYLGQRNYLTDDSIPGYETDPGKLYYILESRGYKKTKEGVV
jgi:hypothetical protein